MFRRLRRAVGNLITLYIATFVGLRVIEIFRNIRYTIWETPIPYVTEKAVSARDHSEGGQP